MKNILIVKLSSIGDVIHALPVSYAVKETYPDARLTWVVEKAAYSLLEENPCIDRLILFKKEQMRASLSGFCRNFVELRRQLKAERYDVSLDLQGLFKSAAIVKVAGADLKLGTADMRELSDRVSRPVFGEHRNGHIVERYLDVARAIGCRVEKVRFPIEVTERNRKIAGQVLEQAGGKIDREFAVLVVGASWQTKCWPIDSFAALADWLYEQKIIPVLVGSGAAEAQTAREIEQAAEIPPVNVVGKLSLAQLAYVMQRAAVIVGGDTGPTHLGAGLGTKTVMLMGPTKPWRTGAYGQADNIIVAEHSCAECMQRVCPKGEDCLAAISVDRVKAKVKQLLDTE